MVRFNSLRMRVATVAFLVAFAGSALRADTLREALAANNAPGRDRGLANMDRPVTSYQVLDDPAAFTIAYYLDDRSGALEAPLIVSRFDRGAGKWQTAELDHKVVGDDSCFGSVTGATSSGGRLYLETHINPSASCTLVLSRGLTVERVLYGWVVAAFDDGRIVYEKNEVHFAAVHPAELSLFNPRTSEDVQLYPRKGLQPIRTAHIEKLRVFFAANQDWCNANNNPCDAEWFNSDISGVVANSATDSLEFVARFDNTDFWSEAERVKLEAFRETRGYLRKQPGLQMPNEMLLSYLVSDLGRMQNLNRKQQVLDLFAAGDELRSLLEAGFAAKAATPPGRPVSTQALSAGWPKPDTWKRLVEEVQVPAEFTEVLYVYRNVRSTGSIEFRELPLDDWKARFGDIPIAKALDLLNLGKIFQ